MSDQGDQSLVIIASELAYIGQQLRELIEVLQTQHAETNCTVVLEVERCKHGVGTDEYCDKCRQEVDG